MWVIIGTIAIVLATIASGVLLDRRFGILPRPERLLAARRPKLLPAHADGEAPATAILASPGELERLKRRKCQRCQAMLDIGPVEHVTYEERDLVILAFHCARCQARERLYVEPAP